MNVRDHELLIRGDITPAEYVRRVKDETDELLEREAETRRQVELLNEAVRESVSGCPKCSGLGWKTWWLWPLRCRFCRGFGRVRCYDGKPVRR